MTARPHVEQVTEYGNAASFWVEYPSGLVDLTRSHHVPSGASSHSVPPLKSDQIEIAVDGEREVRVDTSKTAFVIIDMQNFFLHPEMRNHPTGLACVDPLLNAVPALRAHGVKITWVNWGLTDHELETIPPSLVRGFMKSGRGGFGSELPGGWGRLLMRGERNSDLYGPLQAEYLKGRETGTDAWIHKNRMSGIWGYQTALDLYLEENGITTLLFAGVNADQVSLLPGYHPRGLIYDLGPQCVLGTVVDAYYRGYDVLLLKDGVATTSPQGGLENVLYNAGGSYGFLTDSDRIVKAVRGGA
ncbi:Isochorismatase hydrolase [Artomyces pyxidatus]|uniref:Isochorismatase hydrolase n=1 Tax=Artomyces pyxidatus TaxID=48021 RepID=A0ACB8TIL0_9AGAM|nr:Isochorismatase hydrolase [Artomyces pyxidatus]